MATQHFCEHLKARNNTRVSRPGSNNQSRPNFKHEVIARGLSPKDFGQFKKILDERFYPSTSYDGETSEIVQNPLGRPEILDIKRIGKVSVVVLSQRMNPEVSNDGHSIEYKFAQDEKHGRVLASFTRNGETTIFDTGPRRAADRREWNEKLKCRETIRDERDNFQRVVGVEIRTVTHEEPPKSQNGRDFLRYGEIHKEAVVHVETAADKDNWQKIRTFTVATWPTGNFEQYKRGELVEGATYGYPAEYKWTSKPVNHIPKGGQTLVRELKRGKGG